MVNRHPQESSRMEMSHQQHLAGKAHGRHGQHASGAGFRDAGGRVGEVGMLEGVTEAESVVWRLGLTIKGEHWVCSAGFKERQTEMSCNESPKKTPGILGLGNTGAMRWQERATAPSGGYTAQAWQGPGAARVDSHPARTLGVPLPGTISGYRLTTNSHLLSRRRSRF